MKRRKAVCVATYVGDSVNVCTGQAEMTDDLEAAIVSRQVERSPAVLDKHEKYDLFIQSDVINTPTEILDKVELGLKKAEYLLVISFISRGR